MIGYEARIGSDIFTGEHARDVIAEMPAGLTVAIDIETPGLHDPFTIKCLTASWKNCSSFTTVLLDPARNNADRAHAENLLDRAGTLVLHNSAFDIPGLHVAGLIEHHHLDKIVDTLIYVRMARPDTLERKTLEACAERYL